MLGEICDHWEGADVFAVVDATGRDTRVGKKYLKSAVGYGGPCFPRDTIALGHVAHLAGGSAELALATDKINRRQISRLTDMVGEMIAPGGTAAVLGLSYQPNTAVIEESQGVLLAKSLKDAGFVVVAHDPFASSAAKAILGEAVELLPDTRTALARADVAVIITPWPQYAEILPHSVAHGRTRVIVDCWGQLEPTSFVGDCKIVRLGHQVTIAAACKREATARQPC
jgi:UDPglucose 6-dehydrogenase